MYKNDPTDNLISLQLFNCLLLFPEGFWRCQKVTKSKDKVATSIRRGIKTWIMTENKMRKDTASIVRGIGTAPVNFIIRYPILTQQIKVTNIAAGKTVNITWFVTTVIIWSWRYFMKLLEKLPISPNRVVIFDVEDPNVFLVSYVPTNVCLAIFLKLVSSDNMTFVAYIMQGKMIMLPCIVMMKRSKILKASM